MSEPIITLEKVFSNGPVALDLAAPGSLALAKRIAGNDPFPPGTTKLGGVGLSVKGGRNATLGTGRSRAEFGGSAEVRGHFGFYADGHAALKALAVDDDGIGGLKLPRSTGRRYAAMDWKYAGEANGSVALGGAAAVGIEGAAKGRVQYAVIRLVDRDTGSRDVIEDVMSQWVLPRRVSSAEDLAPGTWIIADSAGSIGVRLGVEYGLSMDWVRESSVRGLSGDIGLKIRAGISASVGFKAAGRFLIVVARESIEESEHQVRVRVFKRARRGIEFGLNAGATFTPVNDEFLPESFDAFLAGALGIDGKQLLGALEGLQEWTDPQQVAENILGLVPTEMAVEEAEGFLRRLLPEDRKDLDFESARSEVLGAIDRWSELEHEVGALLWSRLGAKDELKRLRDFAERIATAGETASGAVERIRGVLEGAVEETTGAVVVEGSEAPSDIVLDWARAVVEAESLAQLLDSGAIRTIGKSAKNVLAVLDEDRVEGVLSEIHGYVSEKIRVEDIRAGVEGADLEALDAWLRGRLEAFLETTLTKAALEDLQGLIAELEGKKEALYAAVTNALKKEYNASLQVAYESASERTALIDVTIDTAKSGGSDLLGHAIAGRFDRVFGTGSDALTVGVGELTHGVRTRLDASVTLPFLSRSVKKVTSSVAKMRVEAGGGGEVRIYELKAESEVEYDNKVRSRLSVAGILASKRAGVRAWSPPRAVTSYQFEIAKKQVLRPRLEQLLKPLVDSYFKEKFAPIAGQPSGLSAWLSDIDRTIDSLEQNGADNFGNAVVRLSVAIPPGYLQAWTNAPENPESPVYRDVSIAMQETMRRVLLSTLTADTDFVKTRPARLAGLLGYASVPAGCGVGFDRDRRVQWDMFDSRHWAFHQLELLRAVMIDRATLARLGGLLAVLHPALAAGGEVRPKTLARLIPGGVVELILDEDIRDVRRAGQNMGTLQSLLFVEKEAIESAVDAGCAAARFSRLKQADPEEALEALTEFGGRITRAFNEKLSGKQWRKALPALSAELFMTAARCFDPSLEDRGTAVLELFVIGQDKDFPPEDLAAVGVTDTSGVILQQRVVGKTR